jgi:outer membrane protein TolC
MPDSTTLSIATGLLTLALGALAWFVRGAIEESRASSKALTDRCTRLETDAARLDAGLKGRIDVVEEKFNGVARLSDEVAHLRKEIREDMNSLRTTISGLHRSATNHDETAPQRRD